LSRGKHSKVTKPNRHFDRRTNRFVFTISHSVFFKFWNVPGREFIRLSWDNLGKSGI
jgi:hypothetical protein